MNIERLLGSLLQEAMSSGSSQFKRGDGRQGGSRAERSGTNSLLGSLTDQLTSGKGLMTAIGLGVGAYEIYRTSGQQTQATPPPSGSADWNAAPPSPSPCMSAPPPPPASGPAPAAQQTAPPSGDDQEMARRLIQVMVAAAHADSTLDAKEEKRILDRLRAANLSQEEKMFLLEELHHPRPIAELAAGVSNLRLAQTLYAVALSAVKVDAEGERQWLDELGSALGLSAEIRRFIEETR